MHWILFLRNLYSLETLDTRFAQSASTPPKRGDTELRTQQQLRSSKPKGDAVGSYADGAQPPRWNTPEFYAYYLVLLFAIPMMFKAVYEVSQGIITNPSIDL